MTREKVEQSVKSRDYDVLVEKKIMLQNMILLLEVISHDSHVCKLSFQFYIRL